MKKHTIPTIKRVREFLRESNAIEGVYGDIALHNAMNAWKYAYKNRHHGFNIPYVLHIHFELMIRLRPDIAGCLRTCPVWIGGRKKHFISTYLLNKELQGWCDITNATYEDLDRISDKLIEEYQKHRISNSKTYILLRMEMVVPAAYSITSIGC